MTFGIKTLNASNVTQLDNQNPIMHLAAIGTSAANVNVIFPKIITSSQQPWLFLRGLQADGCFIGAKFLGAPGRWEGFIFQAVQSPYHNHSLAGRSYGSWGYMVGEFTVNPSQDPWGIRLWDGNQQMLFDGGNRYINIQSQLQKWVYAGSSREDGYVYVKHGLSLPAESSLELPNNYFLVNPIMKERFNIPADYGLAKRKIAGLSSAQPMQFTQTNWPGVTDFIVPGIIGSPSS